MLLEISPSEQIPIHFDKMWVEWVKNLLKI